MTAKNEQTTKDTPKDTPVLHDFYVGKYDLTVQAATAREAVKLAKKLSSKKEDK